MNLKLKIFSSPPFYVRSGLLLLVVALLLINPNGLVWKVISAFSAALIAVGIFGYFKTLPFKAALSEISLGFFKLITGLVIGFIVICCAVYTFFFWMGDPFNLSAPSDQTLMTIFHDHRDAFEKLREMRTEDLWRASFITQSAIEGNITEARKKEYRTLLSEIRPRGFRYYGLLVAADYDSSVNFNFAGGGLSAIGPGWGKGIVYLPENRRRIGTIIQNLDKANTLQAGVYLREIEPNWYIFYQRDD